MGAAYASDGNPGAPDGGPGPPKGLYTGGKGAEAPGIPGHFSTTHGHVAFSPGGYTTCGCEYLFKKDGIAPGK